MFKKHDLTGARFGHLSVIGDAGRKKYGSRMQTVWLCQCDCGEQIALEHDKLPTTPRQRETMMKSGRRLYDCCETCRQKTCVICGNKFSYSHPSHICPSKNCQEVLRLERDSFWHAVYIHRYKTDPEFRAAENKKRRTWWNNNKTEIKQRRADRIDAMSPDERAELQTQMRAERRRWYQRLKSDPERYENWLAWHRQWRTKQQLKTMVADAAVLQSLIENETESEK